MILVELDETDAILAESVAHRCSEYGEVVSITIHRNPNYAMVVMSNRMETYKVAASLGGSTIGTSALINLEQKR
jgi:hypothetical protein